MGMSWGETGRAAVLDDARRDACLHSLGDHYAAGRLSTEELDARIQFALAAETDEDLASVMAGLGEEPPDAADRPSPVPDDRRARRAAQVTRWAAALGALATGGGIVAAVGKGSNLLEFAAGVAVGMLGFLTQWAFTARSPEVESGRDAAVDEARPVTRTTAPDLSDRASEQVGPAPERPTQGPAQAPTRPGPVPRRVRDNGGVIPSQRAGD